MRFFVSFAVNHKNRLFTVYDLRFTIYYLNDMPSGKTHDAITFFLVAPTFAATYAVMQNLPISLVVTAGMLFSGLMFGPDLDVHSKEYVSWGIFGYLWFAY